MSFMNANCSASEMPKTFAARRMCCSRFTRVNKSPRGLKADPETPEGLAKHLFNFISWSEGDRFYEPFKGKRGAFYKVLPEPKDWAEVSEGRDFFTYEPFDGHCEHIITNPPYRTYINGKWCNAYIPILERCMRMATKTVAFLTSHKIFNALTPNRLEKYHKLGWAITKIHVVSVKKWFGRYYFIVFEKGKNPIISWSVENW